MPSMTCATHAGGAIPLPAATSHHPRHPEGEIAMAENDGGTTRRSLMQAVGLGLGAMLAGAPRATAAAAPAEISGAEYWAHKGGGVELSLYRKRVAPATGAPPQPVLLDRKSTRLNSSH